MYIQIVSRAPTEILQHAAEKDFHTDQVKKLMGQCGKV